MFKVVYMEDHSVQIRAKIFPKRLLHLLLLFLLLCCTLYAASIQMIRQFWVYNSSSLTRAKPILLQSNSNVRDTEQWVNPPTILMHNLSDHELFSMAASIPGWNSYQVKRVPKIAFMFLTRGLLPLYPLWERFFKDYGALYSIYIHSLPSFQADFSPSSVFYKRQIPSEVSEWGKMSMCDAERRLLANALLDISNEWFVLLSESCIPLFNFTTIYNYISRSKYSYIGAFDDPGPHGRGRYNESMLPEVEITKWRKGSQWFEINRELAHYIVQDAKFYPKFADFCRPPCYVDEHYFPTMLTIQAVHLLANRSTTWVDWSRGGPHPATFGLSDITEEFMERLYEGHSCLYNDEHVSICYFFARKFSPSSLEALFLIAQKYLGF